MSQLNQRFHRFPREERLKGRDAIRELFSRRNYVSCSGARLFVRRNGLEHNRITFTFPRKYGNAVERNRSRRLSREAYRLLRNDVRKGYDLVLLVYPELSPGGLRREKPGRDVFSTRMNQMRELFSRAGLFKPSQESS